MGVHSGSVKTPFITLILLGASACVTSSPWSKKVIDKDAGGRQSAAREEKAAGAESDGSGTQMEALSGIPSKDAVDKTANMPQTYDRKKTIEEMVQEARSNAEAVEDTTLAGEQQMAATAEPTPKALGKAEKKFVEARLEAYERKILLWNKAAADIFSLDLGETWPNRWHECVQNLEMVLFGYRRALDRRDVDPWSLLQRDIEYAESDCDTVLSVSQDETAKVVEAYSKGVAQSLEAMIRQSSENGDWQKAVEAYENLVSINNGAFITEETKKQYADALKKTGRFKEAAAVIKEIIDRNQEKPASAIAAEVEYADLLLGAGEFEAAMQVYSGVKEEIRAFSVYDAWVNGQLEITAQKDLDLMSTYIDFFRAYLTYDETSVPEGMRAGLEAIDRSGERVFKAPAAIMWSRVESKAEKWGEQQLLLVQDLTHDRQFEKAKAIVSLLKGSVPDQLAPRVALASEELVEAERAERKMQLELQEQKMLSQWETALRLFERKEYDDAVAIFANLLTSEHKKEAGEKMSEAINLAASDMRRKAANLFLKARKTSEPKGKMEAHLESKEVLNQIQSKYPEADIIPKVEQNLQVLDDEIEKLRSVLTEEVPVIPPDSNKEQDFIDL